MSRSRSNVADANRQPVEEQECRRSDQGDNDGRLDDVQRDKRRQSD
jgi:hypothetical protein